MSFPFIRGAAVAVLTACAANVSADQPHPTVPAAQSAGESAATRGRRTDSTADSIVVTATRIATPAFDIPASIDRISGEQVRDARLQVNLSESVTGVPGLLARDRQNFAQDLQLSVRGFGARSTFGIRGVRAYVDGIPATLPDGQGQISNVDLGSVSSIEILRGPFSALYGNSSGGVIQIFTEEGRGPLTSSAGLAAGSDGVLRPALKVRGGGDSFGYVASVSHFRTEGYRDHSDAQRSVGNVKVSWHPGDADKLTFVLNYLDLPQAQDPLGLTRAQFEADPRGVDPVALQFNTRKSVEQTQGGVTYEHRFDDRNSLQVMGYYGARSIEQFQAIPTGPQANALHPGGVISLDRDYAGFDARWASGFELLNRPVTWVLGVSYDTLDETRRGYQNFVGASLGVKGNLRRDEGNDVESFDQYLQASLELASRWIANLGVRYARIDFESADHYIVGVNRDDSGTAHYAATLPVAGLLYKAGERWHLYATAGKGFETPTLNELAYRSDGQTGLNLALRPARSDNGEIGVKLRSTPLGDLNLALFQARTDHEIVTQTNVGGRSTFQNAGSTRRRGVELVWSAALNDQWRAQLSYTLLDAVYSDSFANCAATPCVSPNQIIPAGNRIPGIARDAVFATVSWAPGQRWRLRGEGSYLGRVFVNDLNSDAAGSFATAALSASYAMDRGKWNLSAFARVDNLFDRRYAGSVIVNEGNARYFEPAAGRSVLVGFSVQR